jgi:putative FmdB family regulatory protein
MPTYEYVCKSCSEHLEVVQSFRDEPLTECPACGGVLRKVFGNIGVVLKGSGFYRTDNRPSGKRDKSDAAKSDSGSGESKGPEKKGSETTSAGSETKSAESKSAGAKSSESKSSGSKSESKAQSA